MSSISIPGLLSFWLVTQSVPQYCYNVIHWPILREYICLEFRLPYAWLYRAAPKVIDQIPKTPLAFSKAFSPLNSKSHGSPVVRFSYNIFIQIACRKNCFLAPPRPPKNNATILVCNKSEVIQREEKILVLGLYTWCCACLLGQKPKVALYGVTKKPVQRLRILDGTRLSSWSLPN